MTILGVDTDGTLELLEWWRIVEVVPPRRARLIFVEEQAAEDFAQYMAADGTELVLLEHWRDGARIDTRVVVGPHPN